MSGDARTQTGKAEHSLTASANEQRVTHTPGPWGWTYDGSSDYSIGRESDPQDRPVATLYDYGRNPRRAAANANLIAAAPDLLAALKGLMRGSYGSRCFCDMAIGSPMYVEHSAKCKAALCAIAKTEGR